MKHLRWNLIFILAINTSTAFAGVRLIIWQPDSTGPRIVLPRLSDETGIDAVQRYLKNILQNKELERLKPEGLRDLAGSEISNLQNIESLKAESQLRMAFIANLFQDLSATPGRMLRNINTFSKAGADPFVIALAADLNLSETDKIEFREQVSKNFGILASLGGDDIAPELTSEKNKFARNTNLTRDRSEFDLVKDFKTRAQGVFFGICRGHQMGALADGHRLHQDLSATGTANTDLHINFQGKNSTEMQRWHQIEITDQQLQKSLVKILEAQSSVQVNSVHHQAVDPQPGAQSYPVAVDAETRMVEALRAHNDLSFSVQFHPEFIEQVSGDKKFSERGRQLIRTLVSYGRLIRAKHRKMSCGRVYTTGLAPL